MTLNEEKTIRRYIENLVREAIDFNSFSPDEEDSYLDSLSKPTEDGELPAPEDLGPSDGVSNPDYMDDEEDAPAGLGSEEEYESAAKDSLDRAHKALEDYDSADKGGADEDTLRSLRSKMDKEYDDWNDNRSKARDIRTKNLLNKLDVKQDNPQVRHEDLDEFKKLCEGMARKAVSEYLNESKNKSKSKKSDSKKKSSKSKSSSRDTTINNKLNSDGINAAAYYYKLYGVENGTDAEKASARSKGYKKAKGKKNDTGVPYKFSSKERNRLSSLLKDK